MSFMQSLVVFDMPLARHLIGSLLKGEGKLVSNDNPRSGKLASLLQSFDKEGKTHS